MTRFLPNRNGPFWNKLMLEIINGPFLKNIAIFYLKLTTEIVLSDKNLLDYSIFRICFHIVNIHVHIKLNRSKMTIGCFGKNPSIVQLNTSSMNVINGWYKSTTVITTFYNNGTYVSPYGSILHGIIQGILI